MSDKTLLKISAYSVLSGKRLDLLYTSIKEAKYHNSTLTDFRYEVK